MGLNGDLIELSEILTDEQLVEYIQRLTSAQTQFIKDTMSIQLIKHTNYLPGTHPQRLKWYQRQTLRSWRRHGRVLGIKHLHT
jgi:hypothetical protein